MEGVGARLGRSSTRYGPATVFTGPVRKWKKKWVPVSPSVNNHSFSNSHNGNTNGNNASRLHLYKWTPISHSSNNGDKNSGKDDAGEEAAAEEESEEPPRRKFKYIPIALLEDEKIEEEENEDAEHEAIENVKDEAKPNDTDPSGLESKTDKKPDINDVPMEESQDNNQIVRQDLNESTLDLSLNLNAADDHRDTDLKTDKTTDVLVE